MYGVEKKRVQYGAQFSATKNVNLYFLPWNSQDLKFLAQLASAFILHMLSYRLLNAVFSRVITKMEASFLGPVIGQRAQFSAIKECARFLRINSALLPLFVVKVAWYPQYGPKRLFKYGEERSLVCYCTQEEKLNF